MLEKDPVKRCKIADALNHPVFSSLRKAEEEQQVEQQEEQTELENNRENEIQNTVHPQQQQ